MIGDILRKDDLANKHGKTCHTHSELKKPTE
jgi:hypothetical protein